jgi:hypothetical protein
MKISPHVAASGKANAPAEANPAPARGGMRRNGELVIGVHRRYGPLVSFDRVSQGRLAASRRVTSSSRAAPAQAVLALHRTIGNRAVARLLQRAPASRVTERRTSFGNRIRGKDENDKLQKFADLRARAAEDAAAIVEDLEWDHLWGRSRSDVTGTGDNYSVRIDRQNPTATHSNIQIQTNGTSVSLATVLVPDSLAAAPATTREAVMPLVRAAFLSSLADGMQWEIYDDAPQTTTAKKVPDKDPGGGKRGGKGGGGGGKWNDTRKNRGGTGGGGNRTVAVG